MEDFEEKIDKIASGVDEDEHSWINQIYNKFSDAAIENPDDFEEEDGLEPPMLTETWGLKDEEGSEENEVRTKRNTKDEEFRKDLEGMESIFFLRYLLIELLVLGIYSGEASCKSKLWTCLSKVAMGGLNYINTSDGITG